MSSRDPGTPTDHSAASDPIVSLPGATEWPEIIAQLVRPIRRWARGRIPASRRGINDTSDIVQDVVVRTLARVDVFRPPGRDALAAYLRSAVCNRIADEHRRAARWQQTEITDVEARSQPSPLDRAIDAETWRRYRTALATLGARDQELIAGFLELDYSHAQLACMIGRSPHAARMALTRAMARLAARMAQA